MAVATELSTWQRRIYDLNFMDSCSQFYHGPFDLLGLKSIICNYLVNLITYIQGLTNSSNTTSAPAIWFSKKKYFHQHFFQIRSFH